MFRENPLDAGFTAEPYIEHHGNENHHITNSIRFLCGP